MIIKKINSWFTKFKPYFFTYNNGFFQLSFLANSPELIVESSKKFPFQKVVDEKQLVYTDNPFIKGDFIYAELEKGLWVFYSDMTYKNNVSFHPIYDKQLPANYYNITINLVENKINKYSYKFNNIVIPNYSISFLKPKGHFLNCHFKGSAEKKINIFFDEKWLQNNLQHAKNTSPKFLNVIENKAITFENYPINKLQFHDIIEDFTTAFTGYKPDHFSLKKQTLNFFERFLNNFEELTNVYSEKINFKDRVLIEKTEKYLMENLFSKFLGIQQLSEQFKVSPTKLKTDFKLVYGASVLQYFQTKQMELAQQIIQQDNLLIKDVAKLFQYENVSKFSKKFEEVNQKLPSKVK